MPNILKGTEARYISSNDAIMRLSETFVRFKDEPVYVYSVAGEGETGVVLYTDSEGKHGTACYNDPDLDISSPPLGWVNTAGGPIYASRAPLRRQKQGFCPQFGGYFVPFTESRRVRFYPDEREEEMSVKTIGNTIKGIFPPIKEVLKGGYGGAFSREWAICRKKGSSLFGVFHHKLCVGYFDGVRFSFLPGDLTKTRRESLNSIIFQEGGRYGVEEITP